MKTFRLNQVLCLILLIPAYAPVNCQGQGSQDNPPVVTAGADRIVMEGGRTYLSGVVKSAKSGIKTNWSKASGPGEVTFANANSLNTTATFSDPGEYSLLLTAVEGPLKSSSNLKVKVQQPPPAKHLDVVYTKKYKISSSLWSDRAKVLTVNWIPWCISQIERTDLTLGEGGLDNFIEAGKALRGEPHGKHKGYVFSNAWVHQTVESMCIALMIDPQGDKEIIAAQGKMRKTLEKWIPVILAAQEPDGYLQTAYTLRDTTRWKGKWEVRTRGNHEGYVSGYFIESAINHYTLTEGKDKRLYDAAKRLADCWVANIGPGRKEWYDGHQEMEQALVRFGRFVNDIEDNGRGDSYIKLAKYLLDCRKNGSEYDQSHVPVIQQYEAVGHAVRAAYNSSAMSDVAAETGDVDYQSAVMSLWDNIVNKKYYVTGGIGSGETDEGFGPNYSLRNNAYCEACSSCGLIFFQHKMNIAYHDAKFADLYEETIYNALLGSIDLEGKNFYYDNELSSSQSRYSWHVCPCCVGNIPRTLLMIPTWTYVKGDEGLYVNMFIGSEIKVENVAGTDITMVQKTDYPWNGNVSITLNPVQPREFTLFIRIPDRTTSKLYKTVPAVSGLKSITVNGKTIKAQIVKGYAEVHATWKKGDRVELELPMEVQTIFADDRIEADRNKVALRYGPLIYNVEKADQPDISKYIGKGPFTTEWNKDLLHSIIVLKGKWEDGSSLTAIPNYARNNRNKIHSTYSPADGDPDGGSAVWINKR
ncbi:MAG TPA: beta-L-arabinofuranosidase domain-containing protein [Bacteroidales bacterium]|nr:beta-L-arabinofuranosidase domain-containing protein [Bacteroidales bacterium]